MSLWDDVQSAVTKGLAGSENPYLSTAGGILGGGGGSGPVATGFPPPPPPPPPSPAASVGAVAPSLGWVFGAIVVAVVAALALGVRPGR